MQKYYNQKRLKKLTFSEKSMIYLAIKNIITKKPSKKLDYKYLGLYKVIKRILENNYQLDLPFKVRIYLIFYIFLFEDAINVKLINIGRNDVKVKKRSTKQKKFSIYVITKEKSSIWLNERNIKTAKIYGNQLIIL